MLFTTGMLFHDSSCHCLSFCTNLLLFPHNHRCIGRWLAERSATCPLCKTELWDEEEEESSDEEEEAAPADVGAGSLGWRQLVSLLSFTIDGEHENLVTANMRQQDQQQPQQQDVVEDFSAEPSWWRRWLLQRRGRRGRTLAEQHGVTLTALSEPLLQAENGQVDNNTDAEGRAVEPRPDPPEGGTPEGE
jgi:hypothetical protein